MKDVESLHFKALRMVTLDYKKRRSREWITNRTQRLPPNLWLRFAAASLLMKIWSTGTPIRLRSMAFANSYAKNRKEGLLFGYDSSAFKVGKQETKNWSGSVLSEIKVPWTSAVYDKDRVRVLLKASFYPYNFLVFNHWHFLFYSCFNFVLDIILINFNGMWLLLILWSCIVIEWVGFGSINYNIPLFQGWLVSLLSRISLHLANIHYYKCIFTVHILHPFL